MSSKPKRKKIKVKTKEKKPFFNLCMLASEEAIVLQDKYILFVKDIEESCEENGIKFFYSNDETYAMLDSVTMNEKRVKWIEKGKRVVPTKEFIKELKGLFRKYAVS